MSATAQEHPFRVGQILYRYQDQVVESSDWDHLGFIYHLGGYVEVRCVEGRVERLTPKGARVSFPGYINDRWISVTGRKRFAYPTPAEAWDSYQARKRCQCEHLRRQLLRAEVALALEQPAAMPAQQFAIRVNYPQLPPDPLDRVEAFDDILW